MLVIAGMIARYDEWGKIEWRWRSLLDKYNLAYYRATEVEGASGEFNKPPFRLPGVKLTATEFRLLQEVKDEFFEAMTSGRISGAAVGVPIESFKQVADTAEKLDKLGGTSYYICGHMLMLTMLLELKSVLRSKDLLVFRFDRQDQFETELAKVHADLQATHSEVRSTTGSIRFEDKKKFLPLQVADTLAYECRKYLEKKVDDENVVPRLELKRLMDARKIFKIDLCENRCLQNYLDNFKPAKPTVSSGTR